MDGKTDPTRRCLTTRPVPLARSVIHPKRDDVEDGRETCSSEAGIVRLKKKPARRGVRLPAVSSCASRILPPAAVEKKVSSALVVPKESRYDQELFA